jgi:hypothetical protein
LLSGDRSAGEQQAQRAGEKRNANRDAHEPEVARGARQEPDGGAADVTVFQCIRLGLAASRELGSVECKK